MTSLESSPNLPELDQALFAYETLASYLETHGTYNLDAYYCTIDVDDQRLEVSDYHTTSCGIAPLQTQALDWSERLEHSARKSVAARLQSILKQRRSILNVTDRKNMYFMAFRPEDIAYPNSFIGAGLLAEVSSQDPAKYVVVSNEQGFSPLPLTDFSIFGKLIERLQA